MKINHKNSELGKRWLLVNDRAIGNSIIELAKAIDGTELKTINGKTYVRFQTVTPTRRTKNRLRIGKLLSTKEKKGKDREDDALSNYCAIMLKP